jgi:hypothetical protein
LANGDAFIYLMKFLLKDQLYCTIRVLIRVSMRAMGDVDVVCAVEIR